MYYLITPLLTFLSGKWFFRIAVSSPQRPWSKAKVSILFLLFGSYQPNDKALLVTGFCESEELAHIQSQGASSQVPWSACHFFFLTQDFFLSQCVLRWPAACTCECIMQKWLTKNGNSNQFDYLISCITQPQPKKKGIFLADFIYDFAF